MYFFCFFFSFYFSQFRTKINTKLNTKFEYVIGGDDNRTEYNETFLFSNFEKIHLLDMLGNSKISNTKLLLLNEGPQKFQILKGGLLDGDFI